MAPPPPPEPVVLRSHTSAVNAVKFFDSHQLASGSLDGQLKLWNINTRRSNSTMQAHSKAGVLAIATMQSNVLLTQGRDGIMKLWDLHHLKEKVPKESIYIGSESFCKISVNKWQDENKECINLVASPSSDPSTPILIDLRSGNPVFTMKSSEENIGMCLCLQLQFTRSMSSPIVASSYENGEIHVYEICSGKRLIKTKVTDEPLLAFDLNHSGNAAISVSSGTNITKLEWKEDLDSCVSSCVYTSNYPGYGDVLIHKNQKLFVTAGWDRRIRIFSCKTHKPLGILKYHTESVSCLDFKGGTSLFASGSKDCKVALWDIKEIGSKNLWIK